MTNVAERAIDVDAVLAQLTLAEKAALTTGNGTWTTVPVERLGVPSITMSDGPHGVRRQVADPADPDAMQTLPAVCFPPAVALGSSWNVELVRAVGRALGREARALDVQLLLGPGINIKRSPLCGRNFEYLSEDPHLSGVLGAALVDGIQAEGVGASLKHFAANNQETDRLRVSSDVDERTLREIYLSAFEHVVETAKPWTVMCSYNRLNGTHVSHHRWLLTDVLRTEWGFDGLVVSDWGAVIDRVAGVHAGMDLEMPTSGAVGPAQVVAAVEDGTLDIADLDASARRAIELVARTRAARTINAAGLDDDDFDVDEQHRFAREVAGQCVVLLKNDGVLPLRPNASIAVVGELARTPRIQGAGSSKIEPTRIDDPLAALRESFPVGFAPGYRLDTTDADERLVADARELASSAEVTVVFLGLPAEIESEGFDRADILLPANQRALLDEIAATGTKVVVVLSNGGVVMVSDWADRADAIVEGWLLGQAGGGAIADVLRGVVNPSGRLAETIPVRIEDTPSYLHFPGEPGHVRYAEGVFVGYRYHDSVDGPVSYPFGHGLSYTSFGYSDLEVTSTGTGADLSIEVSARITNTGGVAGREIAQLYVRPPADAPSRPAHELRGFAAVELEPGADTVVRFTLGPRDFSRFDVRRGAWTVDSGDVVLEVGASSRDIRLTAVVPVEAEAEPITLTWESTLQEWASTRIGMRVLERELRGTAAHNSRVLMLLSDQGLRTMGHAPIGRLARYPRSGMDQATIDAMIAEVNAAERAGG